MRISDNRYQRERLQMELALRFLRHEARTQTIRAWTGLTDDRIRKLYRSYLGDAQREMPRHRGKSPHQIAYFSRSLRLQEETVALATTLWLLGVVPCAPEPPTPGSLAVLTRGGLLCRAFEAYRLARPAALISFEHAVFLAGALSRGEQLRVGWCTECGGLMVSEPFALRARRCHQCAGAAVARC
jgi:hypothetical protein